MIPPAAEDVNGVLPKWKMKAGKVMFVLKTTVEKDVLEHIQESQTPKEGIRLSHYFPRKRYKAPNFIE